MKQLQILDCSLRDGSYVNNFSFSLDETYKIVETLDESNLDFIEVGHGIGLGAYKIDKFISKHNDKEYISNAKKAIKNSKLGVFCIPKIAKIDDIKMAKDEGIDFIRIGIEPENIDYLFDYITEAKKLNLIIFINFMKSYTVSANKFAQYVKKVYEYENIDYVYIVDSAGGFLPNKLVEYINEIKKLSINQKLGFHGHNNLGLAIANSLIAVENGIEVIDVSLMGMGRGAGNTYSEQFISILLKNNMYTKINPLTLCEISEKYILPYMKNQYISSVDVISGLAEFHSSFMPIIKKYAIKYNVEPKLLILEVSKIEKVFLSENLVEKVAKDLQNKTSGTWLNIYNNYYGLEELL